MKKLPLRWIYSLREKYSLPSNKMVNTVHSLARNGFIKIYSDLSGEKYIFLTGKGFLKANKNNITPYKYREWQPYENHTLSGDEHRYLIFLFVVDYLMGNHPTTILPDHYRYSRLEYSLSGKQNQWIFPDLLLIDELSTKSIEADTGTEPPRRVFEKLLNYANFVLHSTPENLIEKLELYFVFNTTQRMQRLFLSEETEYSEKEKLASIYNFIKKEGFEIKLYDKSVNYLDLKSFFNIFYEEKISIFIGVGNQKIKDFKKVNFLSNTAKVKNWDIRKS